MYCRKAEAVVNLIAESMLPLSFVETSGFKSFMAVVDSKFSIPSRRTVTRHIRQSLESMKQAVIDDFREAVKFQAVHTVHATSSLASETVESLILRMEMLKND
jgi:hypothetical protein